MLPQLLSSDDYCWDAVEQFIWCFLEVNAGIVCASVPALKPFFMRYLPSLIMAQLSSNNGTPKTGKTSRSRGLDTVVAQNLERRRIQDESYMLSSRDERSISDVKRGFEEDDETKLWDGHQKNPTPLPGSHGPGPGPSHSFSVSADRSENRHSKDASGIIVRRETTVMEHQSH